MALEAGDLDPSGDQVFLEVRGDGDGRAEPSVTLRTPTEPLLHDAVNVRGGDAGHAGMPGLLPWALEAMDEGSQAGRRTPGRMEPFGEPLDLLLEADDPTLLLVDERDEFGFRPALEIGDDGQRPSLSPGLSDTV